MCRFLAYKGRGLLLSELLDRTEDSLIHQSFKAKERAEPLNGDGFGVGWYDQEVDPTPCVYTSITPAWSDRNLRRLSEKIESTCVFAHVRAASPGMFVSEFNCHPFQHGSLLWMHNGMVGGFKRLRRRLRESLSDEAYDLVQGTTDSEHAFAVFVDELRRHPAAYSVDTLEHVMLATLRRLAGWAEQAGVAEANVSNFAVTDGNSIVMTRYSSDPAQKAPTLYLARGERFELCEAGYRMVPGSSGVHAVIVASEPLTADRSYWEEVPEGYMITVTPETHLRLRPIGW